MKNRQLKEDKKNNILSLILLIYLYCRMTVFAKYVFYKDYRGRKWSEAATADCNNHSYDLVMYRRKKRTESK